MDQASRKVVIVIVWWPKRGGLAALKTLWDTCMIAPCASGLSAD
jgi:hypothetical protein